MNTRSTVVAAAVVAGVVSILGFLVDFQNSTFYQRELHARVDNEAQLIRSKIRSQIKVYMSTAENLANQIAAEPLKSTAAVQAQMRRVVEHNPQIVSLALAPGFRVSTVVPTNSDDIHDGTDLRQTFGDKRVGESMLQSR